MTFRKLSNWISGHYDFPAATWGYDTLKTFKFEVGGKTIGVLITRTGHLDVVDNKYKGFFTQAYVREVEPLEINGNKGLLFKKFGKQYLVIFYLVEDEVYSKFIGDVPEDNYIVDSIYAPEIGGGNKSYSLYYFDKK